MGTNGNFTPAPEGWYLDRVGDRRWWDGTAWTDAVWKPQSGPDHTLRHGPRKDPLVSSRAASGGVRRDRQAAQASTGVRVWAFLYWLAAATVLVVGAILLFGPGTKGATPQLVAEFRALALATLAAGVAALLGALMAERLKRLGLDYSDFVRSTTTTRIIVVVTTPLAVPAWFWVLGSSLVITVDKWLGHDYTSSPAVGGVINSIASDLTPLFSILGWATLIGTISAGYSEYHAGKQKASRPTGS